MTNQLEVGFIGLGKLGLPCAEAISKVYSVTGYDIYSKASDKIKIAATLSDAVIGKDLIFIAVQTPHDAAYDGSRPIVDLPYRDFDYSVVKSVLQDINQLVNSDQIVVLISTVLPGTIRRTLSSYLDQAPLVYNPYLIAMGSVAWDMVNPEMLIVGTSTGTSSGPAKKLLDFYQPLMENNPRAIVGTWEEAECVKVFYNTLISAKLSLVNMIQDVAVKLGNTNVDTVTNALAASTTRIVSAKYMTAGMGDAGPCHPRDNIALRYLSDQLNLGYDIFDTIMLARERQAANIAEYLALLQDDLEIPIVIHGKAYKPNIDLVDGSYSLLIGHYLEHDEGARFTYADPLTGDLVADGTQAIILLAHNPTVTYGYTGSDHQQTQYFKFGPGSVVVDPWRQYTATDPTIKVIHYGNTRQHHSI